MSFQICLPVLRHGDGNTIHAPISAIGSSVLFPASFDPSLWSYHGERYTYPSFHPAAIGGWCMLRTVAFKQGNSGPVWYRGGGSICDIQPPWSSSKDIHARK
ncbi:MAG: hypothetical protein IPI00_18140 [Flavobacteriales bacterium]|nr:hypothetical protein [Flavobacteriales bacterium]